MNKQGFIEALKGERNAALKSTLIDILSGATLNNHDGKVEFSAYLMSDQTGPAYGLANWDGYENCNALITHDLKRFVCRDLGNLVAKLRIE